MNRTLMIIAATAVVASLSGIASAQDLPPEEMVAQWMGVSSVPITSGETVTGRLEPGDQQIDSGEYVDYFTFDAQQGESVTISLNSAEFDTYLMLRHDMLTLDNDDIVYGENLNSQIATTLPAAGTYTIGVTSYAVGETGSYTLNFTSGGGSTTVPGGTPPVTDNSTGDTINGSLDASDQSLSTGEYVEYHTFDAEYGERIVITMTSTDFDTYLGIFGPNDYQHANDDAPGLGLNSRISLLVPESGEYQLQATSYAPGMMGSYTIQIERGATSGTGTTATSSTLGDGPLTGALEHSDPRLGTGEFYDEYTFLGNGGGADHHQPRVDAVRPVPDAAQPVPEPRQRRHHLRAEPQQRDQHDDPAGR